MGRVNENLTSIIVEEKNKSLERERRAIIEKQKIMEKLMTCPTTGKEFADYLALIRSAEIIINRINNEER